MNMKLSKKESKAALAGEWHLVPQFKLDARVEREQYGGCTGTGKGQGGEQAEASCAHAS